MENLFQRKRSINDLNNTISNLESNIDIVIAKGTEQEETLRIMRNLLDDIKICTSMTDYLEEELYEPNVEFFRRKNINR